MEWQGHYRCSDCASNYTKVGYCPDCNKQLEKIQACGAASYFCHSCNELKSKSKVRIEFIKQS
ncbi:MULTISPECIES: zinc ribbon domain-containing protein [Vibrio]|uniref:zinc ribbon domain-containing protein n=1 Tax=Vibrio TaxID=662 RepID=UPI002074B9FE|nr:MULTISPECIES: zinc ribbon domain-containing protein [Vibrio]